MTRTPSHPLFHALANPGTPLEEENAVGAGNISGGPMLPIGMGAAKSVHKALWQGEEPPSKPVKTASPDVHKGAPHKLNEKVSVPEFTVLTKQVEALARKYDEDNDLYQEKVKAWAKNQGLELLGEGISRVVYALSPTTVLKVDFGTQNEQEVESYECLTETYAAKIIAYDHKEFSWIIAERVVNNPLKAAQAIARQLGVASLELGKGKVAKPTSPKMFFRAFADTLLGRLPTLKSQASKLAKKSPWFVGLQSAVARCEVDPWDFHEENWGVRSDGMPVLLDYGLSTKENLDEETLDNAGTQAPEPQQQPPTTLSTEDVVNKLKELSTDTTPEVNLATINMWLKTELERLSGGLSREVYHSNDVVVKVARGVSQAWQNKNEVESQGCLTDRFAARIYGYDSVHFLWVVSEYVPSNPEQIKQAFDNLVKPIMGGPAMFKLHGGLNAVMTAALGSNPGLTQDLSAGIPWFAEFKKHVDQCGLSPYDFHASNWGIRENGEIALVDYGFKNTNKAPSKVTEAHEDGKNKTLMSQMGYDYAGKNHRLGSETFVQKNDKDKPYQKKLVGAINKNLDKAYKSPLHNPAMMGIVVK